MTIFCSWDAELKLVYTYILIARLLWNLLLAWKAELTLCYIGRFENLRKFYIKAFLFLSKYLFLSNSKRFFVSCKFITNVSTIWILCSPVILFVWMYFPSNLSFAVRLTIAIGDYAQIVFCKITDIDHIYLSFLSKKKKT